MFGLKLYFIPMEYLKNGEATVRGWRPQCFPRGVQQFAHISEKEKFKK